MQFELLKAQVAKATASAKAFKGFDEMAENDEYLKTDSLNVVVRRENHSDAKISGNSHIVTKGSPLNLPGKVVKKQNSSSVPTRGGRKSTLESFSTETNSNSGFQPKTSNQKVPSSKNNDFKQPSAQKIVTKKSSII